MKSKPSLRYSFGYARAETLGALFSLFIMYAMIFYIGVEAVQRLISHGRGIPIELDSKFMLYTSIFGLGVNIIMVVAIHYD